MPLLLFVIPLFFVAQAEEYGVGDTWTVDGQWSLTVDSFEETKDRNEFSNLNPAAVYIINYTYSNLGYEDSIGIMDGLYFDIADRIVDSDGLMGYTYPASNDRYPQQVPVGAKCKAQTAIGVDTAGLPIKLYVEQYDGNGVEQKAIFVLGGQAEKAPAASVARAAAPTTSLSIADILPNDSLWGLPVGTFQLVYPGTYTSSKVGKSPALVQEGLNIKGYNMNAYYVFTDGALSKITYVLVDDSNKTAVKECASELAEAMEDAIGFAPTKGKGVVEWDNGSFNVQIGTAKLKNYTGKDVLSTCMIFKEGDGELPSNVPNTTAVPSVEANKTFVISLDAFKREFNSIASRVKAAGLVDKAHIISSTNIYKSGAGRVNDVLQFMYNDTEILQLAMAGGTSDIVQIMCTYWPYGKDYSGDFFWLLGETCVATGILKDVTDLRDLINDLDFMNHMKDGDQNQLSVNGLNVGYFVVEGAGYTFYIETP